MNIYIYAIKNLINNKIYVGSTKSASRRKYAHFQALKNNKHSNLYLQHSYNKYGKDKFAFYIIEECSEAVRKEREIFYISKYKSSNPKYGYNSMLPNEEVFSHSSSTLKKIRNIRNAIPVDAYLLDGTFVKSYNSLNECARDLKVKHYSILRILNKKGLRTKNFTFTKKGEPFNYKPSSMQRDMSKFYR